MIASDLVNLLRLRHHKDIFIAECKDGPTYTARHLRMDGWAMTRSWVKPRTFGYEVKVSKADFKSDTKWPGYLPLCNEFYFVAPKGLISPDELEPGVGLLEAVGKGSGARLVARKRAVYRKVDHPENLFRYILMCRSVIVDSVNEPRVLSYKMEYWEQYLRDITRSRDLGYRISRAIRDKVTSVEKENATLKRENLQLGVYKEILSQLGVDVSRGVSFWDVKAGERLILRILDSLSYRGDDVSDAGR